MNYDLVAELLTWALTVIGIVGVVLNAQKKVSGFYFWIVANSEWVVIDFCSRLYAQSFLFAVYTVLAIYGIKQWKTKCRKEP